MDVQLSVDRLLRESTSTLSGHSTDGRGGVMVEELRRWAIDDLDWWVEHRYSWFGDSTRQFLREVASGSSRAWLDRYIAWVDGRRVGSVDCWKPASPDAADCCQVIVEPNSRGRGVGRLLWDAVVRSVPGTLESVVVRDDQRSLAIARHWGYQVASESVLSQLDVSRRRGEPPALPGVTVEVAVGPGRLSDEDEVADALLASQTNPEAVELGWQITLASFRERVSNPVVGVLRSDGRVAAVAIADAGDPGGWDIWFLATRPDMRRRGYARLLKEHLHAAAARDGVQYVRTENEERNTAVRALNTELGYLVTGGSYRLLRPPT